MSAINDDLESQQRQFHEELQHREKMIGLQKEEDYLLFSMLKPKFYIDGNQWCVLLGEDIQNGVCGFGKTLDDAIIDFNRAFHKQPENKQKDENLFSRNGIDYIAVDYVDCEQCDARSETTPCRKLNGIECDACKRKDKREIMWKKKEVQP